MKLPFERRAAVAAGAEAHPLERIRGIGQARLVVALQPGDIDQQVGGCGQTGEWMHYSVHPLR